jgi:hypothetical protein
MELFLKEKGAFSSVSLSVYSFARIGVVAAAIILVLSVTVSSYAYASEMVLPDTPLYPVREAIEQVEVKLAVTPVQKQKVVEKMVERRKQEVEKLTELKRPVPVKLQKFLRKEIKQELKRVPIKKNERQQVRMLQRMQNLDKGTTSTTVLLVPRESASTTESVRVNHSVNERKQPARETNRNQREQENQKKVTQPTARERRQTNLRRLRDRLERLRKERKESAR